MKRLFTIIFLVSSFTAIKAQNTENSKIKLGESAPELAFSDTAGNMLKLSEITKDRVVLIDFWASWCGPCRKANPRLVDMYDRYKGKKFKTAKKGFTILSVSLDKNKEAWVKAIAKDSLKWAYHMSDLGGWESKAAEAYGIQFIPQAFLVGGDGKVIGKYMFAEQAEADLEKMELLKKKKFLFF